MLWCLERPPIPNADADHPTLLLLHGLGGTADLWQPLLDVASQGWPGRILAVDLPGHGRSSWQADYSFGSLAVAVAETLTARKVGPVVVVGHSFGGVVGLLLATGWFGVTVIGAVGLGMKVTWTLADMHAQAELRVKPARTFPTYGEALARFIAVNGLRGVLADDSVLGYGGVLEAPSGSGWLLAHDPLTFVKEVPPVAQVMTLGGCPTVIGCGELDQMIGAEELRALDIVPVVFPGVGHNAHIEVPADVLGLALQVLAMARSPHGAEGSLA